MRNNLRQRVKGWKTIIWSAALAILGLVMTILMMINQDMITLLLPDRYKPFAPLILVIIAGVTAWLRKLTDGPIGQKGDEPEQKRDEEAKQ